VVLETRPLAEGALERLDAVLVGPGLGPVAAGEESREPWWAALQAFGGLLVVDAEGLHRISAAWLQRRKGPTWITPHAGEFRRLFPDLADQPPLEAAAQAARFCGVSVVLKGARSVIAAADGRRWQLLEACGGAARAGLGDGLAGYAAGLGARVVAEREFGGESGGEPEARWLALAALDHAQAGCQAVRDLGAGGATPLAVAELLGRGPFPAP
jgi:NAD(P)H-hydrate epimerase